MESLASIARPNLFCGALCKNVARDRENSRDYDPAFVKDQPPMAKTYQGSPPRHPIQHAISERSCVLGAAHSMDASLSQPQKGCNDLGSSESEGGRYLQRGLLSLFAIGKVLCVSPIPERGVDEKPGLVEAPDIASYGG